MQLAMIGLGRMGGNMAERLLRGGHRVIVYDRDPAAVQVSESAGGTPARDLPDLVRRLSAPRVVWIMVPAGPPVDATIEAVAPHLTSGDVIVDGGNSDYHDTLRRASQLAGSGIDYVDSGTSGGVWGLELGYCLMIGASERAFRICEPAFRTLAPENGYAHVGATGAGHYVKMVHNAIEYGMLQAYAEGYEMLAASSFDLDLRRIADLWQNGSVVRSWINELAVRAFAEEPRLESIRGWVDDSGYGRWFAREAIDRAVPAPVITLSLLMRFRSRQPESFSARVIAALRNQFGGHAVRRE